MKNKVIKKKYPKKPPYLHLPLCVPFSKGRSNILWEGILGDAEAERFRE